MQIVEKNAHELIELLNKKELSSKEITEAYLNRIQEVDSKVEAFITVCDKQAIDKAKEIDEKRAKGESLGMLAGLPIALKDNICTEGILTSCASKMLGNFVPPYDATVTKKIKKADMVILGKLNMDEFAMGSSTENSAYKKTKNPWALDRVPGGSSGGSAASVAAFETPISLGSDTGGSIRQPAHYCGIVGMKPTYGSVSRYGLVAFASSLDQIGPLTKDVKDMALTLNLICGHDRMDSTSAKIEHPDFTKSLTGDIKGMKIALPKEFFGDGINSEVKESTLKVAKLLESMGAIVEEISLDMTKYALPAYYMISSAEASSNLARFDGVKYGFRAEKYEGLLDLYKQTRDEGFGDEVKRRILLGTYALSSGYYDAYYKKAQQTRTLIKNQFDDAFKKYDVILTPTGPNTAFKIGEKISNPVEMYMEDMCTVPINIAGIPALSINSGFDSNGLPIGVQFVGKAFDEGTLLRAAFAYENSRDLGLKKPNL